MDGIGRVESGTETENESGDRVECTEITEYKKGENSVFSVHSVAIIFVF